MTAGLDQFDDGMVVVGLNARQVEGRSRRFRKHASGRGMSETCLPDSFRACQQPGVVQLARCPRARELLDGTVLPGNHGNRSCKAASSRFVTSPGEPDASTSLTRPASSAAMM